MAATKLNSVSQSVGHSLKTLTGNTVHIKIHPRPRNLAESREVLRVLQQYGEVVMYKHLKVSPVVPVIFYKAAPAKESLAIWLICTLNCGIV